MTVINTSEVIGLSEVEQARLHHKERLIERGAQQIGEALRDIRDERLYRQTHATFEAYCQGRWDIGRNYVNKQIAAAEVAATLGTNVPIPEGQARELSPLRDDPDRMREVWNAANEATGGKPTAAAIREARTPDVSNLDTFECESCHATFGVDRLNESRVGPLCHECSDRRRESRVPAAAPRRALPDQFFDAAYDLTKAVERVTRLADDDRFAQNAEKVAAKHRNDLLRAIDGLQSVINRLPSA